MPEVLLPVELTPARAVRGRKVSITVPVGYPSGENASAVSSAAAVGRQQLQGLVDGGVTRLDPFPDGSGADLTVTGTLKSPWSSVFGLRSMAWNAAGRGAAQLGFGWMSFGPEDVSVLDLDADPIPKHVYGPGEGYVDPTGEISSDGSINYATVFEHGAEQGLENTGAAFGKVAKGLGSGVSSIFGGFFSGLGTGGTIVLLVILAALAVLALAYVFGPAFFMGALGGG